MKSKYIKINLGVFIFIVVLFSNMSLAEEMHDSHERFKINGNRLPESELEKKREGSYFTMAAVPAYSPDLGLIIAGFGAYNFNGDKDDSRFAYSPYIHLLSVAGTYSTKGMYSFLMDWDAPYYKETNYRVRSRVLYSRNLVETYFGTDSRSMSKLTNPSGIQFSKYQDYYDSIVLIQDGLTDSYYNYYLSESFLTNINVEKDILDGMGRVVLGLSGSKVWIDDYSGEKVPAKEDTSDTDTTDAIMRTTKLREDYLSGRIKGYDGGWDNNIRLGFAWDTRDVEMSPSKGVFHDVFFVLSDNMLGADYDYSITTLTTRYFYSPFSKYLNLAMALRLSYCVKSGDVPFFIMKYIPTTDKHINGLGGDTTLRGFRQNRFSGKIVVFGNLESRYTIKEVKWGRSRLDIILVPFLDFGRADDKIKETRLDGIKYSYGSALRFGINQVIMISFDLGFSKEESGAFYMNFGSIF